MTTLAIELNDSGIVVARGDALVPESPGFALLGSGAIRFGHDALSQHRLHPRRVQNQFWDRLDFEPLPHAHAEARTQADLAHGHLSHVYAQAGVACEAVQLAVPGSFEQRQLGLLLGIAESCALPVVALVDSAVAASADESVVGDAIHLDLLLHRAVLTHLHFDSHSLVRTGVETSAAIGRISLMATFAAYIAGLFVSRTRFDPLHDAVSEQKLYDLLPRCLQCLREESSAEIEIAAGSRTHRVRVQREELAHAAQRFFRPLVSQIAASAHADEPRDLLLSSRVADLPGLEEALSATPTLRVRKLAPAAAARGCLARASEIRSDPERIDLVTRIARKTNVGQQNGDPNGPHAALSNDGT